MQTKVLKMTSLFFLVISIMFSVGCSSHRGNDNIPTDGTKLTITIQEQQFGATLIGNQTTKSFIEMLPLTLNMSDLNENEKYYFLDYALPTNAFNPGTADPKVTKYLGFTLLPHSGVSLIFTGIAVNTMATIDASLAAIISGTIVSAAIINEIIAVLLAKTAFKWAGEISQQSSKK